MKQIKVSSTLDSSVQHRYGVTECPHCGVESSYKEWNEAIIEVITGIIQGKHGDVVTVDECPRCFEKSWLHHSAGFCFIDNLPTKVKKKVRDEIFNRQISALRDWKRGLCGNCKLLEGGSVDTATHRTCVKGFGPVEFKCEKYKPLKK